MTIEEIRANAPSGATHYSIVGDYAIYYRDDIYAMWLWLKIKKWSHVEYNRPRLIKPL